jgi:hypothetical protein
MASVVLPITWIVGLEAEMNGSVNASAGHGALLSELEEVEKDVWRRGGVDAHRRRCEAMRAAIVAGCSVASVADVLGVGLNDVSAWISHHPTGETPLVTP